jgi:hypothetical protein
MDIHSRYAVLSDDGSYALPMRSCSSIITDDLAADTCWNRAYQPISPVCDASTFYFSCTHPIASLPEPRILGITLVSYLTGKQ